MSRNAHPPHPTLSALKGGEGKSKRSYDITSLLILGAGALAAIYLISAPLAMLLAAAFRGPDDMLPFEQGAVWTWDNLVAVYGDPALYTNVIPNTLIFTAGAVAIGFATAFILAWLTERCDLPFRNTIFALILFPLLVPGVVLAIAWIFLLGPNAGWVNLALRGLSGMAGEGPVNIFSLPGMIVAQGALLVPFIYLLLTAVFRTMNPALEEAASMAGAPPRAVFWRITLPVLRPGILAPLILATLIALEQFEMPLIIGLPARINVFSTRIYYELNPDTNLPAYGHAAAVALPFLIAGLLLLLVYNRLIRSAERFVTVTGKAYRPSRFALGGWKAPALGFVALYLAFAMALPITVLLWTSIFGYRPFSGALLSAASLDGYRHLFASGDFWLALRNTFLVAGASAAIVTLIGALLAWIVLRTKLPGRAVLDVLSFMSIGIPSVIAGLAALLLYLSLPLGVYGTVWVLVLAYSYRLAVATRSSRAGLSQLHHELEEAAAVAGAGWVETARRVVLPLLAPSLLASFVLLFIVGFREFTMPILLQSQDNLVLSVVLWNLMVANKSADAAALGSLIVICVAPVIVFARHLLTGRTA